ncbi:N-acetylneuraminate synthase [Bradyrhizobium centrosematis]|uniref:N-acetylneuraminate synthase n=1 Tax=Bradyrhizobium centrosematis TaxID=1300039 RepID=UPI00216A40A2|nr:N-acetylneuraminate synthase [Bradyrhizobium centrosematis]MCS3765314.1 N-acetylneuraminate synthase [Bradyrhizobium centrosematis]MCS3773986.1 N-acetylneuraminate synthase [Bradyrhizobium centrosematis]
MSDRIWIIAEAGVNHNGVIERALELVDVAADSGADVVKFQTFNAEKLATATAPKADYQIVNTHEANSQLDMLRALELSATDHLQLIERCRERNIGFMSTAFDAESLAMLGHFDMPAIKIPSGDITCADLLLRAARLQRKLIVSTGMATLGEIEQALGVIAFGLTTHRVPTSRAEFERAYFSEIGRAALQSKVTLLHCITEYPAPPETVNLRAMDTMASAFGLPVGYSDHCMGIEISLAAAARGASVIEKHFTLDRTLPGPDHAASLEPDELRQMINGIRNIERALGSSLKRPVAAELRNRVVARRSVVAVRHIEKGEIFTAAMLSAKRPGDGISPMETWNLLGRRASRDYAPDEQIEP